MTLPDLDKAAGCSFGLEFGGVQIKHIQEPSGFKLEQDVIELEQNAPDGKRIVRKLSGRFKMGEMTLTRILTEDDSFEKWIMESNFGTTTAARKGGHVTVFDYDGTVLKRYTLINAWPKSLESRVMKAGDTSVLTEKLVITYEALEPRDAPDDRYGRIGRVEMCRYDWSAFTIRQVIARSCPGLRAPLPCRSLAPLFSITLVAFRAPTFSGLCGGRTFVRPGRHGLQPLIPILP